MKIYYLVILLFANIITSQTITYDLYQNGIYIYSTTNTNYTVTNLQPSTTYNFHVVARDAAGNQSPISNITTITTLPKPIVYCISKGATVKEYINKIQLGSINNLSGNNSGYGNYTSITTNLVVGSSNMITITPAWTGSILSESYCVWVDFNHDGDFLDSGERVFSKSKSKVKSISGSFTIPTTALLGITRMRVSMKYNTIPTSCEVFSNGEVEDYTVNIK